MNPTYDPRWRLVTGAAYGTGYHTRLAPGTPVHPLRESIYRAVQLLAEGGDDAQAHALIDGVLVHQDVDPYALTYGIWPWFADEPLSEMAPPDWNWADFIGSHLCEILIRFGGRLPADLRGRVADALGHAAWSIFRRNVQPGYTNIAIMGAMVAAAAGEILSEPRLLSYARRRLSVFLAQAEDVGSFAEYNSPTYTIVALEEIERILRLVNDTETRVVAERLRRIAWTIIAEHWHPGTGQWAGPHARAYSDQVPPGLAATLAHKTGCVASGGGSAAGWALLGAPCPADLSRRFAALPQPEVEIRRRFGKSSDGRNDILGTTWMDAVVCLGTVNRGTTWTQSRAVLAYWQVADAPAAVLRVQLLKDGKDFASGILWTAQQGPRALISMGLATDQGDWHCSLDRPKDGMFTANDLRLRISLVAQGALVENVGAGWALRAGQRSAVVHPVATCCFDGVPACWETGMAPGSAHVDLVLHRGAGRQLHPSSLGPVLAAFGMEISQHARAIVPPSCNVESGAVRLAWQDVELSHRSGAGPAYA